MPAWLKALRALLAALVRRRRAAAREETAKLAAPSKTPLTQLRGRRIYSCAACRTHTGDADTIIAKTFTGRHGRAFLMSSLANVSLGASEDRLLITGLHTVRDTFCAGCGERLGWKYEQAYEASQRYKVGCFILEKTRVYQEGGQEW